MAEAGKVSAFAGPSYFPVETVLAENNNNRTIPTVMAVQNALDAITTDGDLDLRGGTLQLPEGTAPVNAVAASKVLTVSNPPISGETITIGAKTYKFQNAINALGVAATGTLTVADTPHAADTVVIGTRTYTFRTNIAGVAATGTLTHTDVAHNNDAFVVGSTTYTYKTALTEVKATSTLTLTGNATDGNSVTIGTTKYTFKEALTNPAVAYEVVIGAAATNTIDNLIAAINKDAGEGSTYGTGTIAHPDTTAAAGDGDTMVITAKVPGVAGNSIVTTELSAVCGWTAGTMGSGVDPVANEIFIGVSAEACIDNAVAATNAAAGAGTTYSTGTTAHADVTAAKVDADKYRVTAKVLGTAGNSIDSTQTMTHATWGGLVLGGGLAVGAANDVLIGANAEAAIDNLVLAITAGAGAGTNYGIGTAVHAVVTAVKASASEMTVTAKAVGNAGNVASTATNHGSFATATLTGGADIEAANDVLIGTAEQTIDNLVLAVTAGAGAGTNYGTGTTANATVTAAKATAATMTATALTKGITGNDIVIGEAATNVSWAGAATKLSGGVDGTVGIANQTYCDANYIYHCTAANTIADANWRRVALGSAY